jgi:hypothetical protein
MPERVSTGRAQVVAGRTEDQQGRGADLDHLGYFQLTKASG